MRYVVFSDVHGNVYALEKMLHDLRESTIDGFIYCGDIAGYYYKQEQVIDLIKQLKNLHIVMGNHDRMLVESYRDRYKLAELATKYGNSYLRDISQKYLGYLSNLPEHDQFVINNKRIDVLHGTPQDRLEGRYYPDGELDAEQFEGSDVVFLGHTHYRMKKTIRNTMIINPGSLGQPRDGKGFSYCIFDFETMICEFKTVDFDMEQLILQIKIKETNDTRKKYLINVLYRQERSYED